MTAPRRIRVMDSHGPRVDLRMPVARQLQRNWEGQVGRAYSSCRVTFRPARDLGDTEPVRALRTDATSSV